MKADRNELILNIATEGFWDWNLKTDTAFLSPRYCELVGYSPDDTVFDSNFFRMILHPDDRSYVFKIIEDHLRGTLDIAIAEYRMISKDGTIRWIEGRGKIAEYDEQGAPTRMVGTIVEITKRKDAENALRASDEKLSLALNASKMGVWEWNLQSNAVYWSPECFEIVGLKDFNGTIEAFAELLHPDDARRVMDAMVKAVEQRSFYKDEFRIILPDGEQRWLSNLGRASYDGNGVPRLLAGTVQDITERKRTEETITNSNKLLQTIINTAPMRVFWKDTNLHYLGCNRAFAKDAGVACPDDLIGKDDYQLAWKELAESYRSCDLSVIESGNAKLFIDEPQITPNGDRIWLRTSKVPLCNEVNETIGVLGIYEDITTYKLLGEKLWESEHFLKKTQAIAGVGSYALDIPSGLWESSEELDRIFGIDEAYVRSVEGWTALIHPDDRPMMDDFFRNEVLGQSKRFDKDYRIIRHDDQSEHWVQGLGKLEFDAQGLPVKMHGTIQDITERKLAEIYGEMGREILQILNEPGDIQSSIQRVFSVLKSQTGFDAVGIRLQDGEDYPYFAQKGFPRDFMLKENTLIERVEGAGVCRDNDGTVSLECTCGMVISGHGEKANPFLTPGGSFWTNDSFPLLDIPLNEDPRHHPRNNCIHAGYASVALVPIRNKDRIVGLVQFNDRRKGCFTLTMIELMERIASHIGEAMMRKRDEEELQKKNAEIEEQNAELRDSSYFIENLVMQSAAPIFVLDSHHRIIFWNRALAKLTGLDPDRMVGTDRHWEAFYPECRPTMADLILDKAEHEVSKFYDNHDKSQFAEGALKSSGWFQFPGIGKRFLSFHATPIRNTNGDIVASVETLEDNTETKQIEGMLNDQHRFLQQVLDSLPNPVYYKNRNGAYTGCNRSFEEFFGKEKHYILGKYIADLIPGERAHIHTSYDTLCMKNDSILSFETSLDHADGFPRQVIATKAPLHLNSGEVNGLVGALTDITEQKQIEIALRESEEKFRSISDSAQDAIIMIDNSDRVTFWNAAAEQIFGYSKDEILGRDLHEHIAPPHMREMFKSAFSRYLGSGQGPAVGKTLELPALCKGGREIPLELSLSAVHLGGQWCAIGLARDITARKEAQEVIAASQAALEDKHAELKTIFNMVETAKREWEQSLDSVKDIIILTDADHRIRRCNRMLFDITGKCFEELVHQDWREVLSESGFDFVTFDGKTGDLQHMGTQHQFDLNIYKIYDPKHVTAQGQVISLNDVTDIKEITRELEAAHAELKSAQSQVVQQEKMASIGLMAAGVAHEINNPMAFISCNINSLGKYMERMREYQAALKTHLVDCPDSSKQAIDEVQRRLKIDYILEDTGNLVNESLEGADRVLKIVQNLKSFSRVDQTDEKYADIIQCLESTINIAWNEIKYVATLRKEFEDIPQIRCFPQQLNQVFLNLLVNAAQAISEQGEITVRTWHDAINVFVSVSDTGSGIPEDIQRSIFEPFFTTKEAGKGTGLGLSVSCDIVRKHGGDLMFASQSGQGTTFTVRLPINREVP